MQNGRPDISAIVVCFNEEDRIRDCLESLTWCNEIVVVDSFSTDGTVNICREYTDRIIQRPWGGYNDQKEFALSQTTREWVLVVDADERVSPELRDEIGNALRHFGDRYAAFSVPRLVHYLGQWCRRGDWYPDYTIRIFRRDKGGWAGTEPHDKIVVDGKVRRLKHPLHHFPYRDISDHLKRIDQYTAVSSRELRTQGRRWHLFSCIARPAFRFFRSYIWRRGFLDGFPGFFIAVSTAFYVFLKYAKLWELELQEKDGNPDK